MSDNSSPPSFSPLGGILMAAGIFLGGAVIDQEMTFDNLPPRTGSGLISGLAILSGALLQISKSHSR